MLWVIVFTAIAHVSAVNVTECYAGRYCLPATLQEDSVPCIPTFFCPGNQTAARCAGGHYCPTTTTQIECPVGHYCPPASVAPRECSPFAVCPAGSQRYVLWGGVVLAILVLPLVRLAHYFYKRSNQKLQHTALKKAQRERETSQQNNNPQPLLVRGPLVNIKFSHVRCVIKVRKVDTTLMDGVSGEFRSGRLTAIMGPSGAGKTTLINVLTGKAPLSGGEILINGLSGSLKDHRKIVGFVPQNDTMISALTVRDVLLHSALTRLPSSWSRPEVLAKVDDVLQLLGLTGVQHSRIGDELHRGVSGGEKKRVNIGIELVANPSILFLDEPTTGLDSTTSVDVVGLLKDIAKLKVNVVAILHQPRPEIFQMLDDLLLLAPGGKTVFFGPADNTLSYFTKLGYPCPKYMNPADWYIDVIAGKCGGPLSPAEVARVVAQQRTSSIKLKHMINKIVEEAGGNEEALYDGDRLDGVQPKGVYAIGLKGAGGGGADQTVTSQTHTHSSTDDSRSLATDNSSANANANTERERDSITAIVEEVEQSSGHFMFSGADSFKANQFQAASSSASSSPNAAATATGAGATTAGKGGPSTVTIASDLLAAPKDDDPRSSLSQARDGDATVTVIHFPDTHTMNEHTPRTTLISQQPDRITDDKSMDPDSPTSANGNIVSGGLFDPALSFKHEHFVNASAKAAPMSSSSAQSASSVVVRHPSKGDLVAGRHGPKSSDSDQRAAHKGSDEDKKAEPGLVEEFAQQPEYKPWSLVAVTGYLADQWRTEEERSHMLREDLRLTATDRTRMEEKPQRDAAHHLQQYSKQTYPNFFRLVYLHTYRGLLQHLRTLPNVTVELGLHMLCGAVLGLAFAQDNYFVGPLPPFYVPFCPAPLQEACYKQPYRERASLLGTYIVMALGIAAAVIGNRNFGQEMAVYFREASTGVSTLSYALGKWLSDFPLIVAYSFMFTTTFATVAAPQSTFNDFFVSILFFEFCLFAVGYFSSVFMESSENAQLLAGTSSLLAGLGTDAETFEKNACWGRWLSEALFISEARLDQLNQIQLDPVLLAQNPQMAMAHPAYIMTRYGKDARGFDMTNFNTDIVVLIIMGVLIRILCYMALRWRAHKQRV